MNTPCLLFSDSSVFGIIHLFCGNQQSSAERNSGPGITAAENSSDDPTNHNSISASLISQHYNLLNVAVLDTKSDTRVAIIV
jgi:hypothetical protein